MIAEEKAIYHSNVLEKAGHELGYVCGRINEHLTLAKTVDDLHTKRLKAVTALLSRTLKSAEQLCNFLEGDEEYDRMVDGEIEDIQAKAS